MSIEFHTNDNGVAVLRINRPAQRNALNWETQEAFAAAVTAVAHTPTTRILIIIGTGDQAFVSGGDLKELSHHPEASAGQRLYRVMGTALTQLTQLHIPVIGAINGDAFGGGCEILTACDLRLSAPHVRFCFAQIRNGLTTGWGGTGRLVRLIGHSRAMELLMTGRIFTAVEAQQIGLVHRISDKDEDVMTAVLAWANELISLPRTALAAFKELVFTASTFSLTATKERESDLFARLYAHPDHLEALQAFAEKRQPVFNQHP